MPDEERPTGGDRPLEVRIAEIEDALAELRATLLPPDAAARPALCAPDAAARPALCAPDESPSAAHPGALCGAPGPQRGALCGAQQCGEAPGSYLAGFMAGLRIPTACSACRACGQCYECSCGPCAG
jgi:hypothetical protein